jgi:hypothetical protein
MTDKHLDDAIDRAVREMMSGEPASDLRQRVLDNITRPQPRAFAWSTLAYGSAALAVIVLLVLSLVARRPDVPETRIAGTPTVAPAAAPTSPSPVVPRPTPQPAASSPGRNHSSSRPRETSPRPVGGPDFTDRRVEAASIAGEPALEPPTTSSAERLAPVVPIVIATIGTKEIEIAPITIGRIEIAPLTPRR